MDNKHTQNKKLLILTGPQGSGNHLFSKVFALHPDVWGWKDLNNKFWIAHDQEPFNKFWLNPELWLTEDFGNYKYAFVSISVPYVQNGETVLPNFKKFIEYAEQAGWQVEIAVIGRDINILEAQQKRLRKRITLPDFFNILENDLKNYKKTFVSHELLFLYKNTYLESLSKMLNFPIDHKNPAISDILQENSNMKYIQYIEETALDSLVTNAIAESSLPNTEWYNRKFNS